MARYKLVEDENTDTIWVRVNDGTHPRLAEGTMIPASTGNRDYAEYLVWLAEPNTPDPAD